MLLCKGSNVLVSSLKDGYVEMQPLKLKNDFKKYYAVSMHTHFKQFDITPINDVLFTNRKKVELYKIEIINNLDKKFTLIGDENQRIYTKKGFVLFKNLQKSDLLVDDENRISHLTSLEKYNDENVDLFSLGISYNGNFFCNGILVKSEI